MDSRSAGRYPGRGASGPPHRNSDNAAARPGEEESPVHSHGHVQIYNKPRGQLLAIRSSAISMGRVPCAPSDGRLHRV